MKVPRAPGPLRVEFSVPPIRRDCGGIDLIRRRLLSCDVTLAECLNHLLVERREVVGLARGDEVGVVTTCSSTHLAPAFDRSVFSDGHDVIFFPFTPPASIRVQGPWQITAIGFFSCTKWRTKSIAFRTRRSASGLMTAGQDQTVEVFRFRLIQGFVDWNFGGFVVMPERLDLALLVGNDLHVGAGALERLHRFGQFDLLNPVRRQHRNGTPFELSGHDMLPDFGNLRGQRPCRGDGSDARVLQRLPRRCRWQGCRDWPLMLRGRMRPVADNEPFAVSVPRHHIKPHRQHRTLASNPGTCWPRALVSGYALNAAVGRVAPWQTATNLTRPSRHLRPSR